MRILGLGTATPQTPVTQERAAAFAAERCCDTPQQARLLQTLYRQTGVLTRHTVLPLNDGSTCQSDFYPPRPVTDPGQDGPTVSQRMRAYARCAPELARQAAGDALREAGVPGQEVTQLVLVSCTGFSSPGVEFALIRDMGLRSTIGRTTIGFMGCHGAINGLRVASALASAQPARPVLLCAVELCTLHFQYGWNPQQIVANALFSDGAAAVVGVFDPSSTPAPNNLPRVQDTASCLIPDSAADMQWMIGNHGFEMALSPRVPSLIEQHLKPWLAAWLADRNLTIDGVASWIVHPGGPRVIDAVESALGLTTAATAASRAILSEHGNMSSPTVLFILDRLRRRTDAVPEHRWPCVMLAFGPGLVAEAALLGQ